MRNSFTYNPLTGAIYSPRLNKFVGGLNSKGYIQLKFMGKTYKGHRVAWFLTHGVWPDCLDHINGDRADNRICNLREATVQENNRNKVGTSKSGVKGVCLCGNSDKWQASIKSAGKTMYLGCFTDKKEAGAAYSAAAGDLFGHFATTRHNFTL